MTLASGDPSRAGDRLAEQSEVGEHDRRGVGALRHAVRIEGGRSTEPPEEHLPRRAPGAGAPAGQVRTGQSVGGRVARERPAPRVESRHPVVRAHPEGAVVVLEDAADDIAGQPVPASVRRERSRPGVELVQTVLGTQPQRAGTVEVNGIDAVVAQRARPSREVLVHGEPARGRIEPVQARRVRAEPERALPVLGDVQIGLASLPRLVFVDGETSRGGVETIQSVRGRRPQRSPRSISRRGTMSLPRLNGSRGSCR